MDVYRYIVLPRKQLVEFKMEYWLSTNVFSLHWWSLLFFLIVPWLIWWRLVDKRRIKEIGLQGVFVMAFSSLLDGIGSQLNLWVYPYMLTPMSQKFECYDYSVLPVVYMMIYQKYSGWKFILAQIAASAVFSFILEPLTIYFGLYKMISWKFEYSFIIYPVIGMVCKIISNKINRIENFEKGKIK